MTGEEQTLRALLVLAANTVHPDLRAGIAVIRARIAQPRPWWRRCWDRLTGPHVCDPREDPFDPTDVRCRICGQRPNEGTAAPEAPGTAEPDGWKEPKDMPIIQRRARDVHAGDIITHDPDHDRAVRWRATAPAVASPCGGQAIIDYTDLGDGGTGLVHYPALTELRVEPAGDGSDG